MANQFGSNSLKVSGLTLLDLKWSPDAEAFVILNEGCLKGYLVKRDEIDRVIYTINANGLQGELGQSLFTANMTPRERAERAHLVDMSNVGITWSSAALRRLAVQESGRYVVIGDGFLQSPMDGGIKPLARVTYRHGDVKCIIKIITWDIGLVETDQATASTDKYSSCLKGEDHHGAKILLCP